MHYLREMMEGMSHKPTQLLEAIPPSNLANSFSAPSTIASSAQLSSANLHFSPTQSLATTKQLNTGSGSGGRSACGVIIERMISAEMHSAADKLSFHNTSHIGKTFLKKPILLRISAKPTGIRSPFLLHQHNSRSFKQFI